MTSNAPQPDAEVNLVTEEELKSPESINYETQQIAPREKPADTGLSEKGQRLEQLHQHDEPNFRF